MIFLVNLQIRWVVLINDKLFSYLLTMNLISFSSIFKVGEGRALYNLGNVFHSKGKHLGRLGQQDPGEFPDDVRHCLQTAVNYYE